MVRAFHQRWLAALGLVAYVAFALGAPLAHQWRHRSDHVHTLGGATPLGDSLDASFSDTGASDTTVESAHADFDADLLSLELSDAGHFGVMEVDCSLAAYTMASCEPAVDGSTSALHTFGDELLSRLAHTHSHGAGPLDPEHGRGSPLHLGVALVAPSLFVLPPPHLALLRLPLAGLDITPGHAPRRAPIARGPPLARV